MNPIPWMLALALPAALHAQTAAPPAAASAPARVAAHAQHTAHIRSAHVQRLYERRNTDPATLVERCRFESDISTAPPRGVVALTFDDGPEPGATEHILAVLARHQVPATFFLIGQKARAHPELLALMQAQPGVRLANHSWAHPNFHHLDAPAQKLEVERSEAEFAPLLTTEPRLFRYPYGNSSCEGNVRLRQLGYRIVGWHVDSCDWAFDGDGSVDAHEALSCGVDKPNRHDFLGHVVTAVHERQGGIVLLHEIHHNTVQKLDALVQRLKDAGFSFGALDAPGFAASLR